MLADIVLDEVGSFDWGVETLSTGGDGAEIANPRLSARLAKRVRLAQARRRALEAWRRAPR